MSCLQESYTRTVMTGALETQVVHLSGGGRREEALKQGTAHGIDTTAHGIDTPAATLRWLRLPQKSFARVLDGSQHGPQVHRRTVSQKNGAQKNEQQTWPLTVLLDHPTLRRTSRHLPLPFAAHYSASNDPVTMESFCPAYQNARSYSEAEKVPVCMTSTILAWSRTLVKVGNGVCVSAEHPPRQCDKHQGHHRSQHAAVMIRHASWHGQTWCSVGCA